MSSTATTTSPCSPPACGRIVETLGTSGLAEDTRVILEKP